MHTFERMNMEFRRARTLAERGEWAEAEDAYESARKMAEALGATESVRTATVMRDVMASNARSRLD